MPWICVDLDNTLVEPDPSGMSEEDVPTDGAVEAMQTLAGEGHRLTVYTARFAPMPESEKQRLKAEIEQMLLSFGFPEMEVWVGTTKPACDIFIGDNHVTFDQDWGLALAQTQQMLEDRGLIPPPGGLGVDGIDGGGEEEMGGAPQDPNNPQGAGGL